MRSILMLNVRSIHSAVPQNQWLHCSATTKLLQITIWSCMYHRHGLCACTAYPSLISLPFFPSFLFPPPLCSSLLYFHSFSSHCYEVRGSAVPTQPNDIWCILGWKNDSDESNLNAVHKIIASVHKTWAFLIEKISKQRQIFLWVFNTHIIFPMGARVHSRCQSVPTCCVVLCTGSQWQYDLWLKILPAQNHSIFTALQLCRRGLPMSICLSVCLSVKRVNCDKTKAPSEKKVPLWLIGSCLRLRGFQWASDEQHTLPLT